ncbi:MAG: hypothetical protein RQ722_10865 [Desulfuromonadales bacterium]|nr:hypothetical protein [Desulfuromonadales bacterium]
MQHRLFIKIILVSLFLNLLGSSLVTHYNLPLFLDATGTMLAAILIGPWIGGLLGLMTNLLTGLFHSSLSIPFGLVNLGIGIITGYLMILIKDYRRPLAPLLVGTVIAIATPLMAAPIATYMFGGITVHGVDKLVVALMDSGQSILASTFWGRIPFSFLDKILSAYTVFLIIKVWPDIAAKRFRGADHVVSHA